MWPSSRMVISIRPVPTATTRTSTSPSPWTSALSSRISTALGQRTRRDIGLHDIGGVEGQPAPGAVELPADGLNVPSDKSGDVGAGLRRHPAGAGQLEQLVDAIVETGNLGESFRRFAASSRDQDCRR